MSFVTPDSAVKNALELKEQGNVTGALEELHQLLHGKKFRGNNIILERVMMEMIEIGADTLTTQYLKEDIGHFRNMCQHTNMDLLKNVLRRLKERADEIIRLAEEKNSGEGEKLLKQLLSGGDSASGQAISSYLSNDVNELNPEELLELANCNYAQIESSQSLQQQVAFFIDVCKIILDTLRQNSKMLDFYNQTAQRVLDFCSKYSFKVEYQRISDTLHSHFFQILKLSKNPELLIQSKIPFPVRLDEEDSLQKVLELRYHQLKVALKMKVWSDAFRTTENIYQLINRQKHHASRMKQILSDFFANLSEIFWQSEFYLFHAYAVMNLQQIIKFNKTMTEQQKNSMNAQFVLAVLSVPLNNRMSNFERLSVQYVPPGMEQLQDSTSTARHELFTIANMLQVKGIPSRASLINYLRIKNLHLQPEFPEIQELFRLIEDEESPFTISKKSKVIIDKIATMDGWSQYQPFLVKTISVRILQKCRNYFKNLKMSTLKSLLPFYQTFNSIEYLLYECNREGLLQTIFDHSTQSVIFDQEQDVASNLLRFGHRLREAFQKVQSITSEGKERERIFLKVKEKMEQEMSDVNKRKLDMDRLKEEIARTHAEESRTLQEILSTQQQERERNFEDQKIKEEKERQRNKLLEELDLMRKIRAQEVLQDLVRRGVKKIGNVKISDMERKGEFDYDEVMNYYQGVLKREKEAFETEKQKKHKDVEYWARAVREEEKIAIEKYAKEHGDEEMKQIQKAVRERHEKELKMKQALEKAQSAFLKFKSNVMAQRREDHESKMTQFVNKKGAELQSVIIEQAKSELRKIENIRKVKEVEEKRRKQLEEKEKQLRASGQGGEEQEGVGGWSRGTTKQPVVQEREGPKRGPAEEAPVMTRSGFGQNKAATVAQTEEKKEDTGPKRPQFFKGPKKTEGAEEGGTLSRGQMGVGKKEEEKKEPKTFGPSAQAPPTGSWNKGGPTAAAASTIGGGFQRSSAPAKEDTKKNDKGDDSWSFSGKNPRAAPTTKK